MLPCHGEAPGDLCMSHRFGIGNINRLEVGTRLLYRMMW